MRITREAITMTSPRMSKAKKTMATVSMMERFEADSLPLSTCCSESTAEELLLLGGCGIQNYNYVVEQPAWNEAVAMTRLLDNYGMQ